TSSTGPRRPASPPTGSSSRRPISTATRRSARPSARVYWYPQEDGDGFITGDEGNFDYVVVVIDRRLGESTGWMGARGYDDDWDNLDAWSHMGYPADLNSGQRPTWQGGFRVDGTDAAAQSLLHPADVFPGAPGGAVFGFWDGDVGPRAIAVQSWQND